MTKVIQEENETTSPSDLGFVSKMGEVEVEPMREPQLAPSRYVDENGKPIVMVAVRMRETIEEFTYGTGRGTWKLERNKRYSMPKEVASYLWTLGYLAD